jgi:hypothetical protein
MLALAAGGTLGGDLAGANVPGPPLIFNTESPSVQSVAAGQQAIFQAGASTIGVDFSATHGATWQVSADRGATWTSVAPTAATVTDCAEPGTSDLCSQISFTATLPANHTMYRVVWGFHLCDPTCHWLTHASQAAVLFVGTGERTVTVTKNPADTTVGAGQPARFSAAASGNPAPVVQWYQIPAGSDQASPVALPTARSTTLVVPAANAVTGTRYEAFFVNWLGLGTPYQSPSTAATTLATLTVTS